MSLLRALIYWPCYAVVLVCMVLMFVPSVILYHLAPEDIRWWWWIEREEQHD